MKVILIKDSKDGKANTVVDVSPGYASNFLFKNKLAIPFTKENEAQLKLHLQEVAIHEEEKYQQDLKLKEQIEKTVLWFKLKGTNDVAHGAISAKRIHQALEEQGIHLEKHSFEHINLHNFGTTNIKIKISAKVFAKLKINITKDE
ncbi:50S ribosomal protein L9 [Mesomycoplasma conjunctivae]|uniref:Large ribosomal subunit protein bL9 n=1 Tax=Mesomycoplasma conjunctivae (strain ATCC 25834 / NCTC 10147 / HRC/581) TaxID=572263 RepID=C5J5X2_MESCH|nr:50S ribosomal protein L9 [Mesomycoplasma conjunctivae]CAT04864.1 50S ribosomal protein L9 [Mesomycoplasma conjunctivae]VEU65938.1 50S ribosomal protein L9 [Mesomycoplasma conjunctivae]